MITKSTFSTLILFLCMSSAIVAQCVRTSALQRTPIYNLEGTATLEQFADGSVEFRLSEEYTTSRGPDVQIFLSNDPEKVDDAFFIVDVSEISYYSGAMTFQLPDGFDVNEYRYVVFRCFAFRVFWGNGVLSPACEDTDGGNNGGGDGGMEVMCQETLTATTEWVEDITICPNDGIADVTELRNTIGVAAGDEYAYIFTNTNRIIQEVVFEDVYDFEGSSLETQLVFGVSYRGDLSAVVGQPLESITASECAIVSGQNTFLSVTKEDCGMPFECQMVNTTSNGQTSLTICPSDGQADIIQFSNNGNIPVGENFAYLLTDDQNRLVEVVSSNSFDFEGFGEETLRVFAISFAGNLTLNIGEPISQIRATECMELSDMTVFLTVNKDGCAPSTFNISGQVNSPSGQPIAGVEIMTGNTVLATTDSQGRYTIPSVEEGTSYAISPRATSGLTNGVSATDAVRIRGHIIGLQPFTEPYQIIASDINNDNAVTAADIVQMIRAVVGISTEFSNNTPWRFVDASQSFFDNPLDGSINESINVTVSNADINDLNFIGVKIGDVNDNADLNLNN